ncbi:peptidylprolyl isomerase [Blastococcus sp. TF02A-26]|uniref:peptidylprolyl isomerase n=1 Tax=Blastococcus sp. TF02A-26 TaxID=2250577 RepID=UPI000DE99B47|nr:peptidylprolyl isomerase [Blastococcus sp. TF02A-26]RBY88319.1 peptidylprolyl isomerase [Blastococcus sp. TF02A-26]
MSRLRAAGALAAVVLAVAGCGSDDDEPTAGSSGATVTCDWVSDGSGVDVGTPPEEVPAEGETTVAMTLGQGELLLTLDAASAPCAAASTAHLADAGFFDGSPCHRLVDSATFGVLQCGDPTGTGRGGPGYRFEQEVDADTAYPAGTVAMANSGAPGSTGSQFFICYVNTRLSPDYSVVGTLDDAGLDVVRGIAAAGHDGSFDPSPGGGAPIEDVVIESAEVRG